MKTWISRNDPSQITNCNINARICWATLHGLGEEWVTKSASWLDDGFSIRLNVNEWFNIQKTWRNVEGDTAMFVRFIDDNDDKEGSNGSTIQ